MTKFRDCQRYGVREFWLVDPAADHIQIWELQGGQYVSVGIFRRGERVITRVFDGLSLDPAQVF